MDYELVLRVIAYASLGALAYRMRGMGVPGGRVVCALLVSVGCLRHAAATAGALDIAMALLAVAVATWAVYRPHAGNLNPEGWKDLCALSGSGMWFTIVPGLIQFYYFGDDVGAALAYSGMLKGLVYWLPRGSLPDHKFLWKEMAFGASWGWTLGL